MVAPVLQQGIMASSRAAAPAAGQPGAPVETGGDRPYISREIDQSISDWYNNLPDPRALVLGQFALPGMAAIQWGGSGVQEGPTEEPLPAPDPYTNPGVQLDPSMFLPGGFTASPPPAPPKTELPIQDPLSTRYETPSVEQGPTTMYSLDKGEIERRINDIYKEQQQFEENMESDRRSIQRDLEYQEYRFDEYGPSRGIEGSREYADNKILKQLDQDKEAAESVGVNRFENETKQLGIQSETLFNQDNPQYADEILPESIDIPSKVAMERTFTPHDVTRIITDKHRNIGILRYESDDPDASIDGENYREKVFVSVPNDEDGNRITPSMQKSWVSQLGVALPPYSKHFTSKDEQGASQPVIRNAFAHSQVTERQFKELGSVRSYNVESFQADNYPLEGVSNKHENDKRKELRRYQAENIDSAYGADPERVLPMMKDNRWISHLVDRNVADAINEGYDVITFNGVKTALASNQGMPVASAQKIYGEEVPNRLKQIADEYGIDYYKIKVSGRDVNSNETKDDLDIMVLDFSKNPEAKNILKQNGFKYAKGGLVTKNGCSSGLCAADFLPK